MISEDFCEIDQLIDKWRNRANRNAHIHYACENHFGRLNYLLGVPTIVFTSAVGTSVFVSFENEAVGNAKLLIGIVSFMSAILASLQTFLKYSERAEKHRITSAKYSAIRRRLEQLKVFHSSGGRNIHKEIEKIEDELDSIAESAPGAPQRIRAQFTKQFEEGDGPAEISK